MSFWRQLSLPTTGSPSFLVCLSPSSLHQGFILASCLCERPGGWENIGQSGTCGEKITPVTIQDISGLRKLSFISIHCPFSFHQPPFWVFEVWESQEHKNNDGLFPLVPLHPFLPSTIHHPPSQGKMYKTEDQIPKHCPVKRVDSYVRILQKLEKTK